MERERINRERLKRLPRRKLGPRLHLLLFVCLAIIRVALVKWNMHVHFGEKGEERKENALMMIMHGRF